MLSWETVREMSPEEIEALPPEERVEIRRLAIRAYREARTDAWWSGRKLKKLEVELSRNRAELAKTKQSREALEAGLVEARALFKSQIATHAESKEFWFRRFMTIVGVGNAAAVIAMAGAFAQSENQVALGRLIADPMVKFTTGMVLAGLAPFMAGIGASFLERGTLFRYVFEIADQPIAGFQTMTIVGRIVFWLAQATCMVAGLYFVAGVLDTIGRIRGIVAVG